MNTPNGSVEQNNSLSLDEQRELLLALNPDIIYGVYDLKNENADEIELSLVNNIMTVYGNQLHNIKGLDQCPDIALADLGALRKSSISFLHGNKQNTVENPVLLSNGVLEYIQGSTGKNHLITTLRDGGSFDKTQTTTTAGRNVGYDVSEEVEREHYEEGPYLGKNKKGEYVLCIPEGNEQGPQYVKDSIEFWLKNKYNLSKENSEQAKMIKIFERNFSGVKYEELGNILQDISDNNRFLTYKWDNQGIPEIAGDMRKVSITNAGEENSMNAFVYFDRANNTIEYREVRRITEFPEDFVPLSKRPGKLFLESQNQYSRVPRLENAHKNRAVPTIDYVSKKVEYLLDSNDLKLLFETLKNVMNQGYSYKHVYSYLIDEVQKILGPDTEILSRNKMSLNLTYNNIIKDKDSNVVAKGNLVFKLYDGIPKTSIQDYCILQNALAELKNGFVLNDIHGDVEGNVFSKIKVKILKLDQDLVVGDNNHCVALVNRVIPKFDYSDLKFHNYEKFGESMNVFALYPEFFQYLGDQLATDIKIPAMHAMNTMITGYSQEEEGILELTITDIGSSIPECLKMNQNFFEK